jgi:hypothetical protein
MLVNAALCGHHGIIQNTFLATSHVTVQSVGQVRVTISTYIDMNNGTSIWNRRP